MTSNDRIALPKSITENLNGVPLEMILVPAGKFMMGSDKKDREKPPHEVSVPGFYIGKFQITQKQWQAVMGNNPSRFKGDDLPVEEVAWHEAQAFCEKLRAMTGKAYRLPSEAEWEYACRAGTTGDYAGTLDEMTWYNKNSDSKKHPVGQKKPNAFGLYDMHGNVWEWCEDVWHDNYYGAPPDGSAWLVERPARRGLIIRMGPPGAGPARVVRGGGWAYPAADCRSAYRNGISPGNSYDVALGFRLLRQ